VRANTPVMKEGRSQARFFLRSGLVLFLLALQAPAAFATQEPSPEIPPQEVRFIKFKGVEALSTSDLKDFLKTKEKSFSLFTKAPLDETALAEDLERIKTYYQSQGFYHTEIKSHRVIPLLGREVLLEIEVEEGPPMVISALTLEVDDQASGPWHQELLRAMPLHPGDRFSTPT
jgi:outer membrane protein assembly factor BamA